MNEILLPMAGAILLDIKKTEAGKQIAMFTIKPRIRASRSEAVWSLNSDV